MADIRRDDGKRRDGKVEKRGERTEGREERGCFEEGSESQADMTPQEETDSVGKRGRWRHKFKV